MNKMKKNSIYFKKYSMVFLMLVLIVIIANLCKETSPFSYAKYRTSVDLIDSSRIAKWKITKESLLDGVNIQLDSGIRTEVLDESGNWVFQISNESEVYASIDLNSKIRIRLDNDSFKRDSDLTIEWNFLKEQSQSIDNPISFNIVAYKTNINNLLKFQTENETISYDEYQNLDSSLKNKYRQIIDSKVAQTSDKISILNLNKNSSIKFTLDSENINSKIIYFYYVDIKLQDIVNNLQENKNIFNLEIDENKDITFVINWNVSNSSTGEGITDENKFYNAFQVFSDEVPEGYTIYSNITGNPYSIDGINYYICSSKQMNFYEYTKYSSSLIGNEPGFNFTSDLGGIVRVKYSELNDEQKNKILSYSAPNASSTLNDIKKYVERLEYLQYTSFLKDNDELQSALGYLSYGLKVNIQFDLNVGQVVPE